MILVSCCLLHDGHAQDIHFSQFFEAPLLRNPSLAGIYEGDIRIQLVYRDQWKNITPASFRTASFNTEYKMPIGKGDDFFTIGGQILYDKAGSAGLATTHVLPVVNYHKSLSSTHPIYLSLGFMGGYVQKKIDYSRITTGNQYENGNPNPTISTGETYMDPVLQYWDGSVGMSFNTSFGHALQHHVFIGAAYHHLNRPKASFYKNASVELYPKYVFSGGLKLTVNEFNSVTFYADIFKQGPAQEVLGGGWFTHILGDFPEDPEYTIHGGLFTRIGDAVIPMIKIDKRAFSMTMTYDINISPLKTASQFRGGPELGLSYRQFIERNSSRDKVLCPRF
ncbi:PorP/SprF family type IX secretion system membrane protein [Pseudoflavitalea sp. X16]|nr:PorP/SprF family type IX secretion system membrane protein [Paraflavitalea devenefica]